MPGGVSGARTNQYQRNIAMLSRQFRPAPHAGELSLLLVFFTHTTIIIGPISTRHNNREGLPGTCWSIHHGTRGPPHRPRPDHVTGGWADLNTIQQRKFFQPLLAPAQRMESC